MAKDAAVSIRIESEFKAELEKQAAQEGRTLGSYIERVLRLHHQMPLWKLRDLQPANTKKEGPSVYLPIAEGWPGVTIAARRAEELGEQLIAMAKIARKMPPSS